jgi:hypothetical protein
LLFHGPPGVGKALVTRYLLGARSGHTSILLAGRNLQFVRDSLQLARMPAPSIVIHEDIELIAEERTMNRAGGCCMNCSTRWTDWPISAIASSCSRRTGRSIVMTRAIEY